MKNINELKLAKELIRFPSVTPKDAGAINFLNKNRFLDLKKPEKTWKIIEKPGKICRKRKFTEDSY